ncbi:MULTISPECIES: alpha/beta hydrolase [Streptosporangium]|uniref:Esterase FrsA n=1 Tax=Streptosporangium brasiliense TaxID=47480 RepID=A0ABT9RJW9_9ACTN|nr:alpha/beta fold hydrolase [Streptosporangium brasiliense]MDP9869029.1 esterase FrsA [Streptosporangium brasiliense]
MSFVWPQDPRDLFVERYPQMVAFGLPTHDVDAVRAAITAMWPDAPGGWVYEWSRLAGRYAAAGQHDLAALAYGYAKFPTLANEPKRTALARQVEEYQLAAADFPVDFERHVLTLRHQGSRTQVPVHVLAAPGLPADAPVTLASGGVDGWKMDLHSMLVGIALQTRTRIIAFDLPGTGETSHVPMTHDGGTEIIEGLIAEARKTGNGQVAHFGLSMGGYYSARTGLTGVVDAAINLGGPVEAAFASGRSLAFGMEGIVGNALGFDELPSPEELSAGFSKFNLRHLLDQDTNGPMLVINGADDVHVPQHDTLVFQGRRDTRVELIPGTGHCAVTKLPEVMPIVVDWLRQTLDI